MRRQIASEKPFPRRAHRCHRIAYPIAPSVAALRAGFALAVGKTALLWWHILVLERAGKIEVPVGQQLFS